MDLETALLRMRIALPLIAMLKKSADLSELPEDCLLYMSRVGMVGAGKVSLLLRFHNFYEGNELRGSL